MSLAWPATGAGTGMLRPWLWPHLVLCSGVARRGPGLAGAPDQAGVGDRAAVRRVERGREEGRRGQVPPSR